MWALELGEVESQGITKVGQHSVSQVDKDPDMVAACQVCGDVLRKGKMAFASTFIWEKATPPALSLTPVNLVPPRISLAPFKLLPQCWSSEGVCLSKLVYKLFKRNA